MTNELEKQFFDTFGIEPHYCCGSEYIFEAMLEAECTDNNREKCKTCNKVGKTYPQVTDRILLELICILASNPIRILFESMLSGIKEVELLKNSILLTCIANKDTIKQQVQELFKEG